MQQTLSTLRITQPARVSAAEGRGSGVQAVDRALRLLDLIDAAGGEATLSGLAERSGLNISTCHHLLAALLQRGYVAKFPGQRGYFLGPRSLQLSQTSLRADHMSRRAQRHVDEVSAETGETIYLAMLQGSEFVTIMQREARHAVRVDAGLLGTPSVAHATAIGKAILAWLPEAETRRILALKGMASCTANTITDVDALLQHLRLVRRNGFALDREEFQPHVIGIGAAIRDNRGMVVGAMSASTPTVRADQVHLQLIRRVIIGATTALSAELGNPGVVPATAAGARDHAGRTRA